MKPTNSINKNFFIENRNKLVEQIEANSLIILNSNDIMPTNGDGEMPFVQNSNLFYLCGIEQEETILIIHKQEKNYRSILFIKNTNNDIITWEGKKISKKEAREISGILEIHYLDEFNKILQSLIIQSENVYLNINEHPRAVTEVKNKDDRFTEWCKNKYPIHNYKRLYPIISKLRSIKSSYEINVLKEASSITKSAFIRTFKYIKPNILEYNIQAEFIHEFINQGAKGFAYPPIIASGANACILHYKANNSVCKEGDLLLLDVGVSHKNYNTDITRTIPVNGKFSKRQKSVYSSVL